MLPSSWSKEIRVFWKTKTEWTDITTSISMTSFDFSHNHHTANQFHRTCGNIKHSALSSLSSVSDIVIKVDLSLLQNPPRRLGSIAGHYWRIRKDGRFIQELAISILQERSWWRIWIIQVPARQLEVASPIFATVLGLDPPHHLQLIIPCPTSQRANVPDTMGLENLPHYYCVMAVISRDLG